MKKFVLMLAVAAGLCMVACNNNAEKAEATEEVAVEEVTEVVEAPACENDSCTKCEGDSACAQCPTECAAEATEAPAEK